MSILQTMKEKATQAADGSWSTAQRGAIDWSHKFYDVLKPVIQECYNSVKRGDETRRVMECNNDPNYREKLQKELDEINKQPIWKIHKEIRKC